MGSFLLRHSVRAGSGEPNPDDWRWQLRASIRGARELGRALNLSEAELEGALAAEASGLPVAVTPYYFGLIDQQDPDCPVRRQVVPTILETRESKGDLRDPLGEDGRTPVPHLVHRYPDRALLLSTDRCAVYCRFCTRSRWVGRGRTPSLEQLRPSLEYLRAHREIRDVILSGGDPLVMSTGRLVDLVAAVRSVQSVETIRLATRAPVVLPQRIGQRLVQALRPYHPIWVMTHFNHPRELTPQADAACHTLADAGFPVNNHTVLLKGVNDDPEILAQLFRGLVRRRVRPYYLLQADPVRGSGHLRTPLRRGIALMERLQGRLSGIALPKFIVDTPGGHGKVEVAPATIVSQSAGVTRLRAPTGVEVEYFDPR